MVKMTKRNNYIARKTYEKYLNCKIPVGWEVHHKILVDNGGSDDIENLLLVHHDDHCKMHTALKNRYPTKEQVLLEQELLQKYTVMKEQKIIPEPDLDVPNHGERYRFLYQHRIEVHECKLNGWSNLDLIELYKRWSNDEELKGLNVNLGSISTLFLMYKNSNCKDADLIELYKKWCNNEVLKDYNGHLGTDTTLIINYKKLEFEKVLFDDRAIKSQKHKNNISKANKGKNKGMIPWNKDKKTGLIPWNKGKTGVYSDETRRKMSQSAKKRENKPHLPNSFNGNIFDLNGQICELAYHKLSSKHRRYCEYCKKSEISLSWHNGTHFNLDGKICRSAYNKLKNEEPRYCPVCKKEHESSVWINDKDFGFNDKICNIAYQKIYTLKNNGLSTDEIMKKLQL